MTRLSTILVVFVCFPCWLESISDAQIGQRLRKRVNSRFGGQLFNRNNNTTYPNGYGIPQPSSNGYQPPVVTLRPSDGNVVNRTPLNPYEVPAGAQNFGRRIRTVDTNGNFTVRYYDQNGNLTKPVYGNWSGGEYERRAVEDAGYRSQRRNSWGYAPQNSTRSSTAQNNWNNGNQNNNWSSTAAQTMQLYNMAMARSNAQLQQIYRNSANRRASYPSLFGSASSKPSGSKYSLSRPSTSKLAKPSATYSVNENAPGKNINKMVPKQSRKLTDGRYSKTHNVNKFLTAESLLGRFFGDSAEIVDNGKTYHQNILAW